MQAPPGSSPRTELQLPDVQPVCYNGRGFLLSAEARAPVGLCPLLSGLRAQHSVCTKEDVVGKGAEKARLAEPPVREELPRGTAIPDLPDDEVRAQIQQEVQELMSPSGSFDADVLVIGSG